MGVVHVLGSPTAGRGTGDAERVVDKIRAAGHDVEFLRAPDPVAAERIARDAVSAGAERLVAVGGDGMVRIALRAVASTGTTLGVVPQGTGNDFARAIGLLDGDLDRHVARALAEPVAVDAMQTTHGWVATVATMGFSGDVTARANTLRWPRGQQRYTVATVAQLPRLRTLHLTVAVDGEAHEASTCLLAIGNTAYFGGGMAVCPGARPDDGALQVVLVGPVSRVRFLGVFPRVFSGSHVDDDAVTVLSGRTVTISGTEDEMWADGDPLGPLPVSCEAVAGAVRVAGASW